MEKEYAWTNEAYQSVVQRAEAAEATIERRIAALEREKQLHIMRINGIIRYVNDGAEEWQHVTDSEDDACLYCGYEWPCMFENIRRIALGESDADMILAGVPSDKIEIDEVTRAYLTGIALDAVRNEVES